MFGPDTNKVSVKILV